MMMGPTKKKIIITGVIAFIVPVLIGTIFFVNYSKKKNEEIDALKVKGRVIERFVFANDMLAGEIITAEDIKGVEVKRESAPSDSYESGDKALKNIIGKRMRINAESKTIIAQSMFMNEDEPLTMDERYQEFNMITLPSDLKKGDFIDIRMSMVEGENYIVISGKEVKELGEGAESNTIFLQLNEEEIIRMTAAVLESYMNDGFKLYANKYIDPSNQLYDYERVNYVALYDEKLKEIVEERQKFADWNPIEYLRTYEKETFEAVSGDIVISGDKFIFSGDVIGSVTSVSGEVKITVTEDKVATKDIASKIGLTEKETEDIRNALKENNDAVIEIYDDKLVTTRKDMVNTYPIKENIAKLIKSNPNILEEIKQKYNVEKLIENRAELIEFELYKYNDYGELEATEALQKVQEKINREIETQKAERKEYLQALILKEESSKK